jgi:Protein of unknown function (DUF3551)
MKAFLFALATAAAATALGTPAQAQNYPWCAQYGRGTGGAMNCGFSTYRQCMEDVSGIGGFCMANNTYRPPAALRRHRAHP